MVAAYSRPSNKRVREMSTFYTSESSERRWLTRTSHICYRLPEARSNGPFSVPTTVGKMRLGIEMSSRKISAGTSRNTLAKRHRNTRDGPRGRSDRCHTTREQITWRFVRPSALVDMLIRADGDELRTLSCTRATGSYLSAVAIVYISLILFVPYRRRRARRERAGVYLDEPIRNTHAISGELLVERWRRAAIR